MPKLSIICPTLNHEKYVSIFLDSVINQTYDDFELIIIDDGSTDNNVNIIKSYTDKRIKLYINDYNMGINATFLKGVSLASSDICVFMSSDDIFHKDYVKTILQCFNENDCDIVYTQSQLINEFGELQNNYLHNPVNLSFNEIFRNNFYKGHLSFIPGMAMKKSFINKASFNKGLLLFAYLQLHIDALLYGKIYYNYDNLLYYRYSDSSTSFINDKHIVRTVLETNMLMDTFLQINDDKLIKQIFHDDLPDNLKDFDTHMIPFILGFLAVKYGNINRRKWGYETIIKFYSDYDFSSNSNTNKTVTNSELLYKKYGIQFKDIMNYINYVMEKEQFIKCEKKIKSLRKKRKIASILAVIFFTAFILTLINSIV